jgi:uncharacterized protein YbjT (DUF2867 family)
MKILVTGATGTVGSEVVKALLQRGAEVRALTRKQPEPVKLSDAVEITWGDLSDPVSVTQAMVGVDKLFLLIGNVADEFTQGDQPLRHPRPIVFLPSRSVKISVGLAGERT